MRRGRRAARAGHGGRSRRCGRAGGGAGGAALDLARARDEVERCADRLAEAIATLDASDTAVAFALADRLGSVLAGLVERGECAREDARRLLYDVGARVAPGEGD